MSDEQCMPTFFQSFLDDSWSFIASSEWADVMLAHNLYSDERIEVYSNGV